MTTYHTVYKITNLVNNKIYIGVHKTENLDDGYMGSGKIIKLAIEKYGIEHFIKEIIHVFFTSEEAYEMESKLVTEDFISSEDTYNIQVGGTGGWEHIIPGKYQLSKETRKQIGNKLKGRTFSIESRDKMSNARKKYIASGAKLPKGMMGKSHSEETKNKMSEKASGKNNPNFGKMCITNGVNNRQISKDEAIPVGWQKGLSTSEETKRKQSESAKARANREKTSNTRHDNNARSGESHFNFGKFWITDGINNIMILKSECIPFGWKKGMTVIKSN